MRLLQCLDLFALCLVQLSQVGLMPLVDVPEVLIMRIGHLLHVLCKFTLFFGQ